MNPLLLSLPVLLFAGLTIVLPRGKGCRAALMRTAGLFVGALVPPLLLWFLAGWPPADVITVVFTIGVFIINVTALTLVSLAWQTALSSQRDIVDAMPTALFEFDSYFSGIGSTSSTSGDDLGCLLVVMAFGALFIAGLTIGAFVEHYLLPGGKTTAGRISRIVLSLAYGVGLHAGVVVLLGSLLAG